jgi:uncharacterized protein
MTYANSAFDLGARRTYYTRPMPSDWSRRIPVDTLVGTETEYDFSIPLNALPRVAGEIVAAAVPDLVKGEVAFARQMGWAVARLRVRARPQVVCQRCMQPMDWPIDSESQIALVSDLAAADRVPAGLESFLTEADCVSVRDLVDEEIMLALPTVPLHEEAARCAVSSEQSLLPQASEAERVAEPEVHKPFAQLGELLKRKR